MYTYVDCGCDPTGSDSMQCQPNNGNCQCKEGFSGQKCNIACPEGWTLVGNECLQMSVDTKTYDDAANYCRSIGSSLIEPMSPEENNALVDFIATRSNKFWSENYFWIGINDKAQENKFVYESSGQQVTFTLWASGQPDNAWGGEDCGMLWFRDNQWKWNDAACSSKFAFACQKPISQ